MLTITHLECWAVLTENKFCVFIILCFLLVLLLTQLFKKGLLGGSISCTSCLNDFLTFFHFLKNENNILFHEVLLLLRCSALTSVSKLIPSDEVEILVDTKWSAILMNDDEGRPLHTVEWVFKVCCVYCLLWLDCLIEMFNCTPFISWPFV